MKYLCLITLLFLSGCVEEICPETQNKICNIQLLPSGTNGFNTEFMFNNDCCYIVRFAKNGNFNQPIDTLKMYRNIRSSGLNTQNSNYTFDYDYLVRTNVGDYKVTDFELETKSCRTAWFRKANEYLQLKSYKVNGILQNYTYIMIYK